MLMKDGDDYGVSQGLKQDWVILISDKRLMERLNDYWRHSMYANQVQLRAFTQAETLHQYSLLQAKVDLIVIGSEWEQWLDSEQAKSIWPDTRRIVLKPDGTDSDEALRLYQPLPLLFEQLWRAGHRIVHTKDAAASPIKDFSGAASRVISICSAGGGSGKTTVAFQLARYAAAYGLRVFYWNVGLYPEWTLLYPDPSTLPRTSNSFSQLLYYLRRESPAKRELPIDPFVVNIPALRADTLDSFIHAEEWEGFGKREYEAVLSWLKSSERYDLILVDIADGCSYLEAGLRLSDDIVWVMLDDLPHMNKTAHCWNGIKQADRASYAAICARMHLLLNRYMGVMHNRSIRTDVSIGGFLPYIPHWKQFHRAEQWFGSAVYQAAFEEWASSALPWIGGRFVQERAV